MRCVVSGVVLFWHMNWYISSFIARSPGLQKLITSPPNSPPQAAAVTIPTSGRLPSLNATAKDLSCQVTAANSFMYGVDNDGNLWETDVTCRTSTAILDGASLLGNGNPRYFNGLAYNPNDGTGGTFFWFNSEGSVVSFVRESGAYGIVANSAQLGGGSVGNPSNGAWYSSAFWFTKTTYPVQMATSATLYRVAFNPPTSFGSLPTMSSISNYDITFSNGGTEQILAGFGDIVFDDSNSLLYLALRSQVGSPASPTAPLYMVNVNDMLLTGSATATKIRATGVSTRQLSFDVLGTTLWAHDHNTGMWGTMNTTDGSVTDVFQGPALRDIGGAAQPCACSPTGNSYIYGIGDNKVIYEIDVTSQVTRAVFDASPVRVVYFGGVVGLGVGIAWDGAGPRGRGTTAVSRGGGAWRRQQVPARTAPARARPPRRLRVHAHRSFDSIETARRSVHARGRVVVLQTGSAMALSTIKNKSVTLDDRFVFWKSRHAPLDSPPPSPSRAFSLCL